MALATWIDFGCALRDDRRAAFIASGVAVVLFVWAVVAVIEDWYPASSAPPAPLAVPRYQRINVQAIPSEHLFGSNEIGLLQATDVALTLEGVLTDSDPQRTTAIISHPGSIGKVYRPGDMLLEGVVLYSVASDKVILRVRGQLEELLLVRPTLQWSPPPASLWNASTE